MRIVEVDPDGLWEDRAEILRDKLQLPDATVLSQSETVSADNYLSILPPLGIPDFYNYFYGTHEYNHAILEYYYKMRWGGGGGGEGRYDTFKGGYVLSWSEQSSMCRSMGILAQGPISSFD